ncbi:MAG: TonB-dependent receptor [Nannocystaceae bacterium]|nr:TonB-dependent receptor [Nannocystaceae bacterium]
MLPREGAAAEPPEVAPVPPSPPPATQGESPPSGLREPVLTSPATLKYPEALAELEKPPSGQVVVTFVVDVDGHTKEAEVVASLHPDLDEAALVAVASLVYTPATFEGEPVEVVLSLSIDVAAPLTAAPEVLTPPAAVEANVQPELAPDLEPEVLGPVRIQGVVLEAGARGPVAGSLITAYPAGDTKLGRVPYRKRKPPQTEPVWTVDAEADAVGRFELRGVAEGRVRIVVMTQGFERLEYVVELREGERLELKYYQTRMSTNPYRTEVETDSDPIPEVRRHQLEGEELSKMPGSNGDALKAIQNFPGVARTSFGLGDVTVRGSAPGDSAVFLDGHEMPALFHFGGLTSVFNSSLVEKLALVPGNYDARFGNAIGGVVDIQSRKGRTDGVHGYVKADVFDAAGVIEGPVGKGSFTASIRRSYIDAIIPAVVPEDSGLSFSLAPRYYDYSAALSYPVGGGELTVRALGSDDRMSLILGNENDDSPDLRNSLEATALFHRADLAYRKRVNGWTVFASPSYRRDRASFSVGSQFRFDLVTDRFSGRIETNRDLGKRSAVRFGADVVTDWVQIDVLSPPAQGGALGSRGGSGPEGGEQLSVLSLSRHFLYARPSLYSTFRWGITDRFSLSPGVRATVVSKGEHDSVTVDPRLNAEILATDSTTISAGVGVYSQLIVGASNLPDFGNPGLKSDQALHTSLGVSQSFGDSWSVSATGFYKYLWSLASVSPDLVDGGDGQLRPELFDNAGVGRIYGGEVLVRKAMTSKLFGWVAYTLSRSEIRQRPEDAFELFDYDQTHIFTLIAGYKLPRNWQIGARVRVVSGNPYTPINDAVAQLREGVQAEIAGPYNSARLRAFHQLDFRVDKSWVFRLVKLNAYLDVQNLYNAKNPEFIEDSWNYQNQTTVNSLPIIPSVGLKLEW